MTKRPTILALIGSYLPGFRSGGPVRSMANLVDCLTDEFDFRILTSDRDFGECEPYHNVALNRWISVGPALVHYTSPSLQTLRGLASLIRETPHDVLYLNSFLSPRWTIFPLVTRRLGMIPRRPTIIAPRGEFSSGALALKAIKKKVYISLGGVTGLFSDLLWQASSEHEAKDIRQALGQRVRNMIVARNLSPAAQGHPPLHTPRKSGVPFRIVFLSRISPMKNLSYALRVLEHVKTPVDFSIYGPQEDEEYRIECERIATKLPTHIRVKWNGPVLPREVPTVMAQHDLLFLPTRGENFGHVVVEALAAGTPVLLSDATPWRGLVKRGIGYDLPLDDLSAFAVAIETEAAQNEEQTAAQRVRVFEYARGLQQNRGDIDANRALFASALQLH